MELHVLPAPVGEEGGLLTDGFGFFLREGLTDDLFVGKQHFVGYARVQQVRVVDGRCAVGILDAQTEVLVKGGGFHIAQVFFRQHLQQADGSGSFVR